MSKSKTLFMETTMIDPQKTAGEIISELVKSGATSVNTEYDKGQISGLRWLMKFPGGDILFDMPVRIEPIYMIFVKRRGYNKGRRDNGDVIWPDLWEKASRVAWRQLLRWCQAQLAMIDTGMVRSEEVFMPYIVVNAATNQTLFERMQETQFKMLEAPKQ